jgi:predicted DNA-binding transcriptional regulator AlpA
LLALAGRFRFFMDRRFQMKTDDKYRPSDEALLLTAEDVAKTARISVRSVWRLASIGKLPLPMRLGRSARWKRADIVQMFR